MERVGGPFRCRRLANQLQSVGAGYDLIILRGVTERCRLFASATVAGRRKYVVGRWHSSKFCLMRATITCRGSVVTVQAATMILLALADGIGLGKWGSPAFFHPASLFVSGEARSGQVCLSVLAAMI